ncbi:transglutaminase-like cysteine peptidase [Rhodoligotrophos defluvii]|uniref:transglutaminase-like cysteine peptidase n=1 Tax=Rhodoligotrophos defluvii TaxID=2561934 RepID=UPI0014853069|nr:transglutaminase-like cysteine peptidase [Rhodoligotrophos defluvii]
MKALFTTVVLAGAIAAAAQANAQTNQGEGYRLAAKAVYVKVHEQALPPIGFVDFCKRYPNSCDRQRTAPARMALTPERLKQLVSVNDYVNRKVKPATDHELYGLEEHWTLPGKQGDCEDYALLKQYYLEQHGWPRSTLLVTVVIDQRGDGHAVLTVKTTAGDLILDNQNPTVLDWSETPYQFVKRQSSYDPQIWEALDATSRPAPAAVATR